MKGRVVVDAVLKFSSGEQTMPVNPSDIRNKRKRSELYQKQKNEKKAEQKDKRRQREREVQQLGEVRFVVDILAEAAMSAMTVCDHRMSLSVSAQASPYSHHLRGSLTLVQLCLLARNLAQQSPSNEHA